MNNSLSDIVHKIAGWTGHPRASRVSSKQMSGSAEEKPQIKKSYWPVVRLPKFVRRLEFHARCSANVERIVESR